MIARSPSQIIGVWDPSHPTFDVKLSVADMAVAREYARNLCNQNRQDGFGQGNLVDGQGNGNEIQIDRTFVGTVGEMAVAHLWRTKARFELGYRGQSDLDWPDGGEVDVKTMRPWGRVDDKGRRSVDTCPYNLPNREFDRYHLDWYYVFCTWSDPIVSVAGWMRGKTIVEDCERAWIKNVPRFMVPYYELKPVMCLRSVEGD
jgi:hypothetical protein